VCGFYNRSGSGPAGASAKSLIGCGRRENDERVSDLLYQALQTEQDGARIYETG